VRPSKEAEPALRAIPRTVGTCGGELQMVGGELQHGWGIDRESALSPARNLADGVKPRPDLLPLLGLGAEINISDCPLALTGEAQCYREAEL
jgi:hypothetical protein